MNKWEIYEEEKMKIVDQNLSSKEYEMRIRELLDILNL
jgi:hypothetical protein